MEMCSVARFERRLLKYYFVSTMLLSVCLNEFKLIYSPIPKLIIAIMEILYVLSNMISARHKWTNKKNNTSQANTSGLITNPKHLKYQTGMETLSRKCSLVFPASEI